MDLEDFFWFKVIAGLTKATIRLIGNIGRLSRAFLSLTRGDFSEVIAIFRYS